MSISEDFKKPVNIISLVIAIISICITIYLAISGQAKREPTASFLDSSIVIYNSKVPSSLIKLFNKDSIVVTEDVYLNEIVLWNDGKIPIMPEDVRDTFKIVFNNCKEILDYKIVAQSHQPSSFVLNKLSQNVLTLSWKYFDPNNALKFQIIYTGSKNLDIIWKCNILGVNEIKRIKNLETWLMTFLNVLTGVLAGVLFISLFNLVPEAYDFLHSKREREDRKSLFKYLVFTIISMIILFAMIYLTFIEEYFINKTPL